MILATACSVDTYGPAAGGRVAESLLASPTPLFTVHFDEAVGDGVLAVADTAAAIADAITATAIAQIRTRRTLTFTPATKLTPARHRPYRRAETIERR
jgi:hypothetical protein